HLIVSERTGSYVQRPDVALVHSNFCMRTPYGEELPNIAAVQAEIHATRIYVERFYRHIGEREGHWNVKRKRLNVPIQRCVGSTDLVFAAPFEVCIESGNEGSTFSPKTILQPFEELSLLPGLL